MANATNISVVGCGVGGGETDSTTAASDPVTLIK